MKINEMRDWAHAQAVKSGWWDEGDRPLLEMYMLIVTELAEAAEEVRKGTHPVYCIQKNAIELPEGKNPIALPGSPEWESAKRAGFGKPEGQLIELADAVIRIGDICGRMGWDLENAIKMKMEYNATRPYRHGNKKY